MFYSAVAKLNKTTIKYYALAVILIMVITTFVNIRGGRKGVKACFFIPHKKYSNLSRIITIIKIHSLTDHLVVS